MDKLDDNAILHMSTLEDADTIRKNIEELIQFCVKRENMLLKRDNIDHYKRKMMDKYSHIHQKYPTLFFIVIENPTSFPISRLEEMLSLKKQIENNQTTNEQASVHLGQKYYDEFVKDQIKHLGKK